ncbi:RanBP1 domain protein, partial [Oesophagostomum dentatum]
AQPEFVAQAKSKLAFTDRKDQKDKGEEESNKEKGGKDKKDDEEAEHGADEEYEPDVQFAPVNPLPDVVDVVTGEEEKRETNENKEHGVGDLKVLRNLKINCRRVAVRSEQVHKVCANLAILPSIELNEKKRMPNVCSWIAQSHLNAQEIFTAKLKTAEIPKKASK